MNHLITFPQFQELKNKFTSRFPDYNFTDVKILDLLLWQYRPKQSDELKFKKALAKKFPEKPEKRNYMIAQFFEKLKKELNNFCLENEYRDEQKELQPHLKSIIDKIFPEGGKFSSQISVGGNKNIKKPRIDMLGTNFWPDIEISHEDRPIIGIEVKLIKKGKSASKGIAESIGQSFIYRLKYKYVISFVINNGTFNNQYTEYDNDFKNLCLKLNIELIIRKTLAT